MGSVAGTRATVHGLLTNPTSTGVVSIGRTRSHAACTRHSPLVPLGRVRGGHHYTKPEEWMAVAQVPAIITREQFDAVQAK